MDASPLTLRSPSGAIIAPPEGSIAALMDWLERSCAPRLLVLAFWRPEYQRLRSLIRESPEPVAVLAYASAGDAALIVEASLLLAALPLAGEWRFDPNRADVPLEGPGSLRLRSDLPPGTMHFRVAVGGQPFYEYHRDLTWETLTLQERPEPFRTTMRMSTMLAARATEAAADDPVGEALVRLKRALPSDASVRRSVRADRVVERRGSAVLVNLPTRCRFDCCFCTYDREPEWNRPGFDALIEAIKPFRAQTKALVFTGNDPLEDPEIGRLVSWGQAEFPEVAVQTPGDRLRDADLLGVFLDRRRLTLQLPVYAAAAALHDRIMGRDGSFEWLSRLVADERLNVALHTLVLSENLHELQAIREFARASGRHHEFRLLAPRDLAPERQEPFRHTAVTQSEALAALRALVVDGRVNRAEFLRMNGGQLLPCVLEKVWGEDALALLPVCPPRLPSGQEPCPEREGCLHGERCPGIPRAYRERFGLDEVRPRSR